MLPRVPDSTVAFLREGYTFISAHCDELGADAFRTRVMLRPALCVRGAEAAAMFYDEDRVGRRSAMPRSAQHLLQDEGSVQSLTGSAHRHRKRLFVEHLGPGESSRLATIFGDELARMIGGWKERSRVVLHDEVRRALTVAACRWVGLEVDGATAARRSREFGLMIDRAASFGPPNWIARRRRRTTEEWAAEQVRGLRESSAGVPESARTIAEAFALHRDEEGELLPEEVAALELLNLLRPTVAVGRFMTFAAVAMIRFPVWASRLAQGSDEDLLVFSQEVRRYFPFFPLVGGTAKTGFEWNGEAINAGQWILLDLYGTNHDPRAWRDPESFDPERFRGWTPHPNTLIPQGGGDIERGHRCPGEAATIELIKACARLLAQQDWLRAPAQDLTIDLRRIPALPRSGVILSRA
ncbi:cytochrome P450 [Sinomonas gamaensis]|uniref:cytochrome P450 n=1 Tax=Sinomonas gamaensis TaxID=2565624 RepID=UPI00201644B3|nr:cytochrome P450 [Sinomonas gamaensis]